MFLFFGYTVCMHSIINEAEADKGKIAIESLSFGLHKEAKVENKRKKSKICTNLTETSLLNGL